MGLTLELETLFLEVLNTSSIYPITSKVHFVKELANSILTYVPNMIHICPNKREEALGELSDSLFYIFMGSSLYFGE